MRRRYQQGSVSLSGDKRYWIGKYRNANGKQTSKLLGKVREISKSKAREQLAEFLRPTNTSFNERTIQVFLKETFFPLFTRKWKGSTLVTNRSRIEHHIGDTFGTRSITSITREDLQTYLDSKASLSRNTVSHLRWDLKQIFDLAMAEGFATKNPALMLFVPKGCTKAERKVMSRQDVQKAIAGLELKERLVFKLATVAGMRPGEIFGLKRERVLENAIDVQERICRGQIDTPKTARGVRSVGIASILREDMDQWLEKIPASPDVWLFPSETLKTPMTADNFLIRHLRPALETLGLGWVNFQVMRRTNASLMHDLKVDPKVAADMRGHHIGVSIDVYTQSSIESRIEAVETLGNALVN